jgi:hypothetical protein
MKYYTTILALLLVAGISTAANLHIENWSSVTASSNYDWTLTKAADKTDLNFAAAPDPNPQTVTFTITITRTGPLSSNQVSGNIFVRNDDGSPVTITQVLDQIVWNPTNEVVATSTIFDGSVSGNQTISAGDYHLFPFVFPFTTPYPLNGNWPNSHIEYVNVYTSNNELLTISNAWTCLNPSIVNETLHVWDTYTALPSGFTGTPAYSPAKIGGYDNGNYWTTFTATTVSPLILTLSVPITNVSASSGSYSITNTAYGINECGSWSSSVELGLHVSPPPNHEWEGYTYTPGYWKNHPCAYDQWLPITIAGVTITSTSQGHTILSRSGQSYSPWYKFLCHFFATKLNTLNSPGMLNAYYNDITQSGEFMEGQTVAYIIGVANTYRSSTSGATLLAMKDVCDAMNQDNQNVLWNTPSGGSGSTVSLTKSNLFTLYPNPFTNQTEIRFMTNNNEPLTLKVYDISGTKVRDLVKTTNSTLYWDGTDNNGKMLTRGVYIIRANNTALKALINR